MVHNINYRAIKAGATAALPKEIALSAIRSLVFFLFKGKIDDNAAFHRLAQASVYVCVCPTKDKNFH